MWKIQKLLAQHAGPRERPRESLPKPPPGMAWLQNQSTKEWKLVPADKHHPADTTATGTTTTNNGNKEEMLDFSGHQQAFDNPFEQAIGHGHETSSVIVKQHHHHLQQLQLQQQPAAAAAAVLDFGEEEEEESKSNQHEETDWELLSDRHSSSTHHTNSSSSNSGIAFVTRNGSIASGCSSSSLSLHKKTLSSSTLDSHDLGPSGKGVLGVDYVEHVILPTDTMQGICLAYKISASRLKRANHFSGETLAVAPKKLVIPISKQAMRQGYLRVQDTDSKEYKLHALQAEFPQQCLGVTEAKAYLELADWALPAAMQSAREDFGWEKTTTSQQLRAGEIRVMMDVTHNTRDGDVTPTLNFSAQGAGFSTCKEEEEEEEKEQEQQQQQQPMDPRLVDPKRPLVEQAASHHNSFGLEMKSLSSSQETSSS
ncbi:expressed unknown protein [Seminavis robusta]|uniref:LysM domain-containing protein n=1 Tax=Seminavis robusta TaxID=568900 RepID=A0A9N8E2T9_9STRA|nr:expressed unknown protein [Seminavis robusta]|eukprot:Sro469_g149390.1 n/a (426) ;mRNA; r:55596-56973